MKSEIFRRECVRLCVEYIEESNGGRVPKEVFRRVLTELLLVDRRLDWRNCPVHIVQDGTRFSLPDLAAALFASVPFVYEPEDFVRQLGTCDVTIRKAWERTKRKLAQTVRAQGLDFKLWERRGDSKEFSVRIDRNFEPICSSSRVETLGQPFVSALTQQWDTIDICTDLRLAPCRKIDYSTSATPSR